MTEEQKPDGDGQEPVSQPPQVDRQRWFVPENAATDEQLEALRASIDVDLKIDIGDLPGGTPSRSGGWYSPEGSTYQVEPAEALGDLLEDATYDILDEIEAVSPEETAEAGITVREAPSWEGEFPAYRETPEIEGTIPQDFLAAPDMPLSTTLDVGLGGLRDVPAVETAELEIEDESLSLEEAGDQQEDAVSHIPVPAQGFGGVQDRLSETTPASEQPTIVDDESDTGPIAAVDLSATRVLSDTDALQPEPTPVTPQPTPTSDLQIAQSQVSEPMSPQQPPAAQRFKEVEQSVQVLRQQFAQGRITRNQLETELRRLMVLDDQGRWWTLGVDSSRWYRYDGREWTPDTPPQTGPVPAVGIPADYVRTETGVQPPVREASSGIPPGGDIAVQQGGTPQIAIDEYGMPLPQRVPQEDPEATMVNVNAAISPDEYGPTLPSIEKPGPAPAPVAEPVQPYIEPSEAQTLAPIPSVDQYVAPDGETYDTSYDYGVSDDGQLVTGEYIGAGREEKRKATGAIQPDYSEALGGRLSRSGLAKIAVWSSVVGVVVILGSILCALLGMIGYYFYTVGDYSEAIASLPERASTFQTTTIYANDGVTELATFNDPVRGVRQKVELEDISPWVIHALVSTEDETYYENPGFSVFAIMRAAYTNFTSSAPRSGASTITQQLARRLLLNEEFAAEVSASRKMTEIILAAEISRQYTKDEILELYLNEMSFGSFTVGIEAAAQAYFGKPASDLNIFESALLVGLIQSPGLYDPFQNRELALGRMETVLRLMQEANGTGCVEMEHTFNGTGYDLSQPLCVTEQYLVEEVPHLKAIVQITEFEPQGTELRYAHFVYWVREELFDRYGEEYIYNTGLRVITTIDPVLQNAAQAAVVDQVTVQAPARGIRVNNGSVVAIDPQTGAVMAMVGSADFRNKDIDGEVNVAFQPRQPGSSIKPVVYLTSFEGYELNGVTEYWTPATIIWDTPSNWGGYEPVNYDRQFRGPVSVRRALSNSLNVPAVKAMAFVSPERFEVVANRMGITFPLQSPVAAGLPAALGAAEVRLFDMVAGYAAFANNGMYNRPFGVLRVQTVEGEVIYDWQVDSDPAGAIQTVDPALAFLINSILSDSETRREEFGTDPTRLDLPDLRPAAVKTGTTNDNRDAWTIGWTPQIAVGVWVGNTDNSEMGSNGTGWNVASPIWNRTMWQYLINQPVANFPQPSNVTQETVCVDSGTYPPSNNPALCGPAGTLTEYFAGGRTPPSGEESLIVFVEVDIFTNLIANQFCPDYSEPRAFLNVEDPTVIPWLRTQTGRQWAASRDLDPDNLDGTIPTGECQAGQEVPIVNLTSPQSGMTIANLMEFRGQASAPNFSRYEIQYAPISTPDTYTTIVSQNFEQESASGLLGSIDSHTMPNGQYYVRVVVFSTTNAAAASPAVLINVNNVTTGVPSGGASEGLPAGGTS